MARSKTSPADLQEYLRGVRYPATKEDLESAAKDSGAPQEILDAIDELPDEVYDAPTAVSKASSEVM
ncbi:MAG: DUF2795 domain-containing protein [Planctomycetaceae bacterium]|nr:DUF2795 domain-containing protein [Planctomycetaceae bacterium]